MDLGQNHCTKGSKLHVSGICPKTTLEDIKNMFQRVKGIKVLDVDIRYDSITGFPRGFCYVTLSGTQETLDGCIKNLNNTKWRSGRLRINSAKKDFKERILAQAKEGVLNTAPHADGCHEKVNKGQSLVKATSQVLRLRRRRNDRAVYVDPNPESTHQEDRPDESPDTERGKRGGGGGGGGRGDRRRRGAAGYAGRRGFVHRARRTVAFPPAGGGGGGGGGLAAALQRALEMAHGPAPERTEARAAAAGRRPSSGAAAAAVDDGPAAAATHRRAPTGPPSRGKDKEEEREEEEQPLEFALKEEDADNFEFVWDASEAQTRSDEEEEEEEESQVQDQKTHQQPKGSSAEEEEIKKGTSTMNGVATTDKSAKHADLAVAIDGKKGLPASNMNKKERSNQQRLEALRAKMEQAKKPEQNVGHIDIHKNQDDLKNKITFDSSSGEEDDEDDKNTDHQGNLQHREDNEQGEDSDEAQQPGTSLWSDSEEEGENEANNLSKQEAIITMKQKPNTDEDMFKLKPEFEGKEGKKLLDLQKRFGGDQRFRLDARFAENLIDGDGKGNQSSDEEGKARSRSSSESSDGVGAKIAEEASSSLSILRSMFPDVGESRVGLSKKQSKDKDADSPTKNTWGGQGGLPARYDPTAAGAGLLEEEAVGGDGGADGGGGSDGGGDGDGKGRGGGSSAPAAPAVDAERSITRTAALKSIFHKQGEYVQESDEEKPTFSFFKEDLKKAEKAAHTFSFFGNDQDSSGLLAQGVEKERNILEGAKQQSQVSFPEFTLLQTATNDEPSKFLGHDNDELGSLNKNLFGQAKEGPSTGGGGSSAAVPAPAAAAAEGAQHSRRLWLPPGEARAVGALFRRTASEAAIERAWLEARPRLAKDCKRKHKAATKFTRATKVKKKNCHN